MLSGLWLDPCPVREVVFELPSDFSETDQQKQRRGEPPYSAYFILDYLCSFSKDFGPAFLRPGQVNSPSNMFRKTAVRTGLINRSDVHVTLTEYHNRNQIFISMIYSQPRVATLRWKYMGK